MVTQAQDVSSRRQAMRERVKAASGGFPPAWKPEPEDLLEGALVRYEHFTGNTKATPCDVAIIADTATEAEVAVFIRNAILVDCFKRLRPRPGEFVFLRFLGKSTTSRANLWVLDVDRDPDETESFVPTFDVVPDLDNDGADVTDHAADEEEPPF